MGWKWGSSTRQYTDTSSGDVISRDDLKTLQQDFVGKMQTQMSDKASELINRGASPDEWEAGLRPIIDRTQAISYQLARGGSNAMSNKDWNTVSSQIGKQYDYLNAFAQDAGTGQLTEDQATARAAMYAGSGNAAAALGRQATYDGLELPCQPGDGETECLTACQCDWSIEETDDGYEATWVLGGSNNCPGCLDRAEQYSPYVQSKGGGDE